MNAFLLLALLVAPSLGAHVEYIIGGIEVVDATKYPYMVSLQKGAENVCGGAIIADRWIVTTAHCVGGKIDFAVMGRLSMTDDSAGNPVYYTPIGTMRHEDYVADDAIGNPNDIGLIKVQKAIVISDTAQIIPLAAEGDVFANCAIMGWGQIEVGIFPKPKPDRLHEAAVDVFSQAFCMGRWSTAQITENHICAGVDGVAGACTTDRGGPLACDVNGEKKLAGVTSFTQFTCGPSMPSVFTRISKYVDWINGFIQ